MINKAILFSFIIATGAMQSSGLPAQQKSWRFNLPLAQKEIRAVNRKLSQDLAAGNVEEVAASYTLDAQFMVPNMPSVTGRNGIKAVYSGMFQSGASNLNLTTKEVNGDGNLLEEVGTYTLSTSTGKQLDRGKYLVVWKKEASKWKLYRDCFNTDLPVTKSPD
jgi:uncharacterized protein (TIGR02246 family)